MARKPNTAEGVPNFVKFRFWFSSEEQVLYPKGVSSPTLVQILRKNPWGSHCVGATVRRAVGNTKASTTVPQMYAPCPHVVEETRYTQAV